MYTANWLNLPMIIKLWDRERRRRVREGRRIGTSTTTCVPKTDEMMMKLWDREGRRRFGTSTIAQCVKKMRKDATDVRASLLFLAIVGNSFHNLRSLSFAQLHAGRRRRRRRRRS
jgi:hypothetical protein